MTPTLKQKLEAALLQLRSLLVRLKEFFIKPPAPQIDFDFPAPIPSSKYSWGTTSERIHSTRLICDEEGLSWDLKNKLCATVNCESEWRLDAKNENKDKNGNVLSTDWGICQYNDYYFIGKNKPIPTIQDALTNPELCIRVMARQFKAGGAYQWICYKKLFGA